tara:strand:+ start:919 stop:1086 length:168 start_codon:yes stop_codon:yes gene_type:complete
MDLVVPLILVAVTFIFEPGNTEINNYCRSAVADGTFKSRIECWNYYHEYRDDIPK